MANTFVTELSGLMFHTFMGTQQTKPQTIAVGLTSSNPTSTTVVELANQSGYARQVVGVGGTNWSYVANGNVYNKNTITFPVCSGYVGWTSGLFVSDSGAYGVGSILFFNSISPAKEQNTNDQIIIPVSGLVITLT